MVQFHGRQFGCVEGNGVFASSRFQQFALGDKQKLRFGIHEPADQPRTGDAIHLDVLARDPFHEVLLHQLMER